MTAEFLDLAKPMSELTSGEAYLLFMASKGPDDPLYMATFERLKELLHGPATGYAWKVVGRREGNEHRGDLVADAVQNAFLRILRQQRRDISQRTGKAIGGIWKPEGNDAGSVAEFSTWFNRVVRSAVMDLLRSEEKFPQTSSEFETIGKDHLSSNPVEGGEDKLSETPPDDAISAEKFLKLKTCIDNLEDPYRSVLSMMFYERKSQSEIAEQLKTNNTAISRWKNTAITRMQECIGNF